MVYHGTASRQFKLINYQRTLHWNRKQKNLKTWTILLLPVNYLWLIPSVYNINCRIFLKTAKTDRSHTWLLIHFLGITEWVVITQLRSIISLIFYSDINHVLQRLLILLKLHSLIAEFVLENRKTITCYHSDSNSFINKTLNERILGHY